MRTLAYSMVCVLIAGSYRPVVVLVLHGPGSRDDLVAAWAWALLVVAFNLAWSSAPTWLRARLYVLLGWAAVAAGPQLGGQAGLAG